MAARMNNRRVLKSSIALLSGLTVLTTGLSAPALAEIAPGGTATAGVYLQDLTTETDSVSNLVYDIEHIGDVIYVSGKFLETRPSSAAAATSQAYIAAYDAATGEHLPSFQPVVEGPVYALQASADGSQLFIGGEFIDVAGDTGARGLAAIDPTTGALDPTWRTRLTTDSGARPIVFDMVITNGSLYAAGRFDTVDIGAGGQHRSQKVVKVDLVTSTVDTGFAMTAQGGPIRAITAAPDGGRIYVGGNHSSVDGAAEGGYFTVLDPTTGAYIPNALNWNSSQLADWFPNVYAVAAVNNLVFVAGANNAVQVFDVATGQEIARHHADGDFQRLSVVGDRVYGGGHFYEFHRDQAGNQTDHSRIVAYSATTGEFIPSFDPNLSAERSGVWAIHGAPDGCLWVGGDLSSMMTVDGTTRALGGFARFCENPGDGGGDDGPPVDVTPPTAPAAIVQTRAEDRKIVIKYSAATDDGGISYYEVRRDGILVDTEAGGSRDEWFVDAAVEPGTSYVYEVVAVDPAGNVGPAATVTAATTGEPPPDPNAGLDAPQGLRTTRQERNRIVLNWQAVTGADHYVIQVDDGAGFVDLGPKGSRWFTHSGLTADTSYTYRVLAVDGAGNRGAASTPLTVSTIP